MFDLREARGEGRGGTRVSRKLGGEERRVREKEWKRKSGMRQFGPYISVGIGRNLGEAELLRVRACGCSQVASRWIEMLKRTRSACATHLLGTNRVRHARVSFEPYTCGTARGRILACGAQPELFFQECGTSFAECKTDHRVGGAACAMGDGRRRVSWAKRTRTICGTSKVEHCRDARTGVCTHPCP